MTTFLFTSLSLFVPVLIILSEFPVRADTLNIASAGANNRIAIDSINIQSTSLITYTLPVFGRIKQNGISKRVEIIPIPWNTFKYKKHSKQNIHITQTEK